MQQPRREAFYGLWQSPSHPSHGNSQSPPLSTSNSDSPHNSLTTVNSSSSMLCEGLPPRGQSGLSKIHETFCVSMDSHIHVPVSPSEVRPAGATSVGLPPTSPMAALSAQASKGQGGCRVSKKRGGRSASRAAITIFPADVSSFQEMVQQLTGMPTLSSPPSSLLRSELRKQIYTSAAARSPIFNTSNLNDGCSTGMQVAAQSMQRADLSHRHEFQQQPTISSSPSPSQLPDFTSAPKPPEALHFYQISMHPNALISEKNQPSQLSYSFGDACQFYERLDPC
ncbi:hypothetical protein KP509_16G036400 [Ceratopteris richardii]|uniref:VQ domain-containing protein n=1 Tax=Ceratopteris richardii TaxID=49495 RepID=A0A8T2T247_CERRI|nr:hypothetical protein KP509_16G036400 [Ceratopteris richardii]